MKGIVLAAGRGSRIGEATRALPKPLLQVGSRRCIDFAIDALLACTDEVIVVTGYMADAVEEHLRARGDGARVRSLRNHELEAGNLTSLRAARDAIGGDPFILTNADHLFPTDMYTRHFVPDEALTIACERNRPILEDEMKVVERDGRLAAIAKTLGAFDGAYIGTTSVGASALRAYWQAFDTVTEQADLKSASVEMVLDRLAKDGGNAPVACWIDGLRWFEVDTEEDLAIARKGLGA